MSRMFIALGFLWALDANAGDLSTTIHFLNQWHPSDGVVHMEAITNTTGASWYIKFIGVSFVSSPSDASTGNLFAGIERDSIPARPEYIQQQTPAVIAAEVHGTIQDTNRDWLFYSNELVSAPFHFQHEKFYSPDYFLVNPGESIELCVSVYGFSGPVNVAAYLAYTSTP